MSDPFEWLRKQTVYPKILIGDQAAVGCAKVYSRAVNSDERLWGGIEFDGPWKAFWLPKIDLIDGKELHHAGEADLPPFPDMHVGENISKQIWIEQVEKCLEKIESKELSKVVLARKVTIDPVKPVKLNFWFEPAPGIVWMGNTPEQLFWREGNTVYSEALAGTHTDEEVLLGSEKDRSEFEWVKRAIEAKFEAFCTQVEISQTRTKRAGNICHLHASIKGDLKDGLTDSEILKALHPTPAMGGLPWEKARTAISQLENFRRGLYAAPLGFYSKERSKFIVCIRCALLIKNKMHLFSGTGIVKGSDPKMEWDELNRKVELWTQVS